MSIQKVGNVVQATWLVCSGEVLADIYWLTYSTFLENDIRDYRNGHFIVLSAVVFRQVTRTITELVQTFSSLRNVTLQHKTDGKSQGRILRYNFFKKIGQYFNSDNARARIPPKIRQS